VSKRIAILQSNYIPWKGYFDLINSVDEFIIYDDMQYTKRDWRNRNRIKTNNGLFWLSIPIDVKGKVSQKIKDTKISNKNWGKEHWKIIAHSYAKAKFYKEYKDLFEDIYNSLKTEYLSEINYRFITETNKILNIKTKLTFSSNYILRGDKTERLVDLCKQVGATEYISGPAAKNYIESSLFEGAEITLKWMSYDGYKEYEQLYPPFSHYVSIIDLIFNTGIEFKNYMNSF
jgi:hypothetical protein